MILHLTERVSQDISVFKYAVDILTDVSGSQIISAEKTAIFREFGFRGILAVGCAIVARQDFILNRQIGARFGFIPPLIMTLAVFLSVFDGLEATVFLFSMNIISQIFVVDIPVFFMNKNSTNTTKF